MNSWKLITLAGCVLPRGYREWAGAMAAELNVVPPGAARRRFVRGCVTAIVLRGLELRCRSWLSQGLLLAFLTGFLIALVDRAGESRAYMWAGLLGASAVAGWCRPAGAWRSGLLLAAGMPLLARALPEAGPYVFDRADASYGIPPAILVAVLASLCRRRLRPLRVAPVLALLLAGLFSGEAGAQRTASRLTAEDLTSFADSIFRDYLQSSPGPSLAFVVVKGDSIIFARGYGSEDPAGTRPVDPERTVFWMASLSKLLTTDAVMREHEARRLQLDAPAEQYLGWGLPVGGEGRRITVQNLLTHTAGLDEPFMLGTVDDSSRLIPLNDYLRSRRWRAADAAGAIARYSNHGMALAGAIVEQVSGIPFAEYVQRRIFEPLGMNHSTFRQPIPAALAIHVATAGTDQRLDYLLPAPSGAMMATAMDMGRFLVAQLDDSGARRDALRRMHATHSRLHPDVPGVALGWFETVLGGVAGLYHTGARHHFSVAWIAPAQHTGLFLVHSMRQGGPFQHLRAEVIRAFAERYLQADAEAGVTHAAEPAAVGGVYRPLVIATTTVERVANLFLDTPVELTPGGALTLEMPGLGPIEARPSGNGYQVVHGPHAGLRVGAVEYGGVSHLAFGGSLVDPVTLVRLSWWQRGAVHAMGLLLGSVALIVAALMQFVRRLRGRVHPIPAALRRAWRVITAAGLFLLAAPVAALLVVATTPESGAAEHMRRGLYLVLPLFTLAAVLAGGIPVLVLLSRLRGARAGERSMLLGLSLAGLLVSALLWHYRLVGLRI